MWMSKAVSRIASQMWIAGIVGVLVLLAPPAAADSVSVDCDGGPANFSSIQGALNTLDLVGPHLITVTGTCQENPNISQRSNLTIEAPVGQIATIKPGNPLSRLLIVFGSQNIRLRRLVFDGAMGIQIGGVGGTATSGVTLENSRIENSQAQGLVVNPGSALTLLGNDPAQPVVVAGSAAAGIRCDGATLMLQGFVTVENNAGIALFLTACNTFFNGGASGIVVRNNAGGISLTGGHATFNGANLIQNNGGSGIQVGLTAGATFNAGQQPAGVFHVTIIEDHTQLGMNIAGSAGVSFAGPHKVRNNGSPGTGEQRGGIVVGTTSRLQTGGGMEITGNLGAGVIVRFNGAIALLGTTVSGNTEGGVVARRSSVASLDVGNNITGNSGSDVVCDETSLVFGSLEGVGTVNCKQVEKAPKTN